MNKNLKIGLIVLSALGVSVGAYFAIKFYKLKEAYSRSLISDDVLKIVEEKAQDLGTEMEEDPDLQAINACDTTDPNGGCFEGCPDGYYLDENNNCSSIIN